MLRCVNSDKVPTLCCDIEKSGKVDKVSCYI